MRMQKQKADKRQLECTCTNELIDSRAEPSVQKSGADRRRGATLWSMEVSLSNAPLQLPSLYLREDNATNNEGIIRRNEHPLDLKLYLNLIYSVGQKFIAKIFSIVLLLSLLGRKHSFVPLRAFVSDDLTRK